MPYFTSDVQYNETVLLTLTLYKIQGHNYYKHEYQ